MSSSQDATKPDKPTSMIEADTANGEAPDPDENDATGATQPDGAPVAHPTGEAQAKENLESDPPA